MQLVIIARDGMERGAAVEDGDNGLIPFAPSVRLARNRARSRTVRHA